LLQFVGSYQFLRKTFGWLTLALFAYVGAAILAKPHASEFLPATFVPRLHFTREYLAMLVALIGTRLSPYVYFWEASQRVERETLLGRRSDDSTAELKST